MTLTGGNAVVWDLAAGSGLDCIFFNTLLGTPEPVTETPIAVPTAPLEAPIEPTGDPGVPVDPTAEPVPTEFVPDLVGPTPTWIPDGSPGVVWVVGYTCPAGYDTSGASLAVLEADCRADTTVTDFSVANDAGFFVTQTATLIRPPFMQQTIFRNVPASVITITQSVPAGHSSPIVFCSLEALGLDDFIAMSVSAGNQVAWNLASGSEPVCIFFNTLLETPVAMEDNILTIVTFACPAGTNRAAGLPDLGTTCDPMPDISFAVTYPGSGAYGTSDASGRIDWTGLPAGAWSVFENVPAGYGDPVAFCGPMYETETPPVSVVAGEFFGEFAGTGQYTVCTVFNIPVEIPVEPGTGTVRLSAYACPAGVERSDVAYTLSEQCITEISPVTFGIVDDFSYDQSAIATAGVPQTAEFSDVPFGFLGIAQTIPTGYGEPLVFCAAEAADGPGAYMRIPLALPDTVVVDHRADAEIPLSCMFFNFPEAASNTVTVDKYVCPPGANAETDVLLDVCTLGGDGIEFEFVDGSGSRSGVVTEGSVAWTDVVIAPVGELQIIETIPAGYGEPLVACDGLRMDATGGFVVPNPGEARPFHVTCDWFNFVDDDRGSLSIVKHDCPAGYDAWAPGADPFFDCTVIRDGVTFELTGGGVEETGTTGEAGIGIVDFPNLAPGEYVVTEWMPPGTESAFVGDCFGLSAAAVHPFPLATGDTLALVLAPGDHVSCHWFNVHAAEHASLVIEKFTCSTLIYVAEVDCQVEEDGATFDLLVRDGDAWEVMATMTTDGYGRATFGDLAPGEYKVQEHGGPWCQMVSDGLGADGVLSVTPDTATVVKVYNCDGTPGEPGELPTTYPNTGAELTIDVVREQSTV
jgi:hypothetical protein